MLKITEIGKNFFRRTLNKDTLPGFYPHQRKVPPLAVKGQQ
jgi:hypothetical protein